jgi:hypothetical protein
VSLSFGNRYPTAGIALLFVVAVSACATAPPARTPEQTTALIERLEEAKRTDLQTALQPGVGPVAQGDLETSATYADRVIGKLRHGDYVTDEEIDWALAVPPTSLSEEQRGNFIRLLDGARARDAQGIEDYSREPDKSQDFAVQMKMASQTIRELRHGDTVSWWAIHQALHVPQNP